MLDVDTSSWCRLLPMDDRGFSINTQNLVNIQYRYIFLRKLESLESRVLLIMPAAYAVEGEDSWVILAL